ncbi:hypothetical protein VPH35_013477 [Triticum aestivum]
MEKGGMQRRGGGSPPARSSGSSARPTSSRLDVWRCESCFGAVRPPPHRPSRRRRRGEQAGARFAGSRIRGTQKSLLGQGGGCSPPATTRRRLQVWDSSSDGHISSGIHFISSAM